MNPDHSIALSTVGSSAAVTAVLLSARGASDGWEAEVFEALCRSHSHTHLHLILPPPTNLLVQLCDSMSAAYGAFTGALPEYANADDVVEKLAIKLASGGRSWSWAESSSVLMKAKGVRAKPRSVLGRPQVVHWEGPMQDPAVSLVVQTLRDIARQREVSTTTAAAAS